MYLSIIFICICMSEFLKFYCKFEFIFPKNFEFLYKSILLFKLFLVIVFLIFILRNIKNLLIQFIFNVVNIFYC